MEVVVPGRGRQPNWGKGFLEETRGQEESMQN